MLTGSDAVGIYKMKLVMQNQNKGLHSSCLESNSLWGKTRPVAKLFGTNIRTVKYIWNRKTWAHATKHLWAMETIFRPHAYESKVIKSDHYFLLSHHNRGGFARQIVLKDKRNKNVRPRQPVGLNQLDSGDSGEHIINLAEHGPRRPLESTVDSQIEISAGSHCSKSDYEDGTVHHDNLQWLDWLDQLAFSVLEDPFRFDWPHW